MYLLVLLARVRILMLTVSIQAPLVAVTLDVSLVEHLQRVQQTPVRNKKILSKVYFLELL